MYVPAANVMKEEQEALSLIRANGFAALVTAEDGRLEASQLPLILDERRGKRVLLGHWAKANPQSSLCGARALAIFSGPHAYVSPTWYGEAGSVPTWNYVAVHVTGTLRCCAPGAETMDVLRRLTDFYEKGQPKPWSMASLDDRARDGKLSAIVAFRLEIERIEGKAKLGQNRTRAARRGVISALSASARGSERELAELMEGALE